MNAVTAVRAPRSLRSPIAFVAPNDNTEIDTSLKVTVACLVAAGSITGAEAQQSPLPPVTIDAPVTRPRPPAATPTPEQIRVRNELRRLARERQKQEQAAPNQPRTRPGTSRLIAIPMRIRPRPTRPIALHRQSSPSRWPTRQEPSRF